MRHIIRTVMTVVPALLFVACRKISMNGNPVGLVRASSMSPKQNSKAINMPKPITPFSTTVLIIAQGTMVDAL